MPVGKQKVLKGRAAIDAYRAAHRTKTPEEHTPLLDVMLAELKKQGFNSLKEFFDADKQYYCETHILVGECNRCGICCEGCSDYLGNGNCGIYESRPQECKDAPTLEDFYHNTMPKECSIKAMDNG